MTEPRQTDELMQRYLEASVQDTRRPGAHVRDVVRAHAENVIASTLDSAARPLDTRTPAANQSRWKISLLASIALAAITGLLVLQFDRSTPEEKELVLASRLFRQHRHCVNHRLRKASLARRKFRQQRQPRQPQRPPQRLQPRAHRRWQIPAWPRQLRPSPHRPKRPPDVLMQHRLGNQVARLPLLQPYRLCGLPLQPQPALRLRSKTTTTWRRQHRRPE